MNNAAFRNLVSGKKSSPSIENESSSAFKQPAAGTLGSRARSLIPMTPRNVAGSHYNNRSEFARQVAEANSNGEPPLKKFRSSAAPKGTRLASGYVDRTSIRRKDDDATDGYADDRATRLNALEEMLKLQQIDQETFDRLRTEMGIGGDVSSTHLVKGLDWKLLARVRRGEDVTQVSTDVEIEEKETPEVDVDEELEKALEREISDQPDETASKESDDLVSELQQQRSLTRDEILLRLKQSRSGLLSTSALAKSQQRPPDPVLNGKFKKAETKSTGPTKEKLIEDVNGRRRGVLLIIYPDGSTKRKTKWIDPELTEEQLAELKRREQAEIEKKAAVDFERNDKRAVKARERATREVMGMEVPVEIAAREAARKAAEEAAARDEDDDIFQGVGADYNPLGDIESESEAASDTDEKQVRDESRANTKQESEAKTADTTRTSATRRNYFAATTNSPDETEPPSTNLMVKDPTILAALKRAADIRRREEESSAAWADRSHSGADGNASHEPTSTDKSKAFLQKLQEQERQDAADLDMGFGGSRFADDEDDDREGEVLHDIHDNDDDGGEDRKGSGAGKRKRGPKKRKGDKNDLRDVMGVLKGRQKNAS